MIAPGDVVLLDFPGAQGVKPRPAVVVSTALYHSTRPDVIVGPLTSQVAKATAPTDYLLQDWAAAGLHLPSAFRVYLVTVLQSDIHGIVGKLSAQDWNEVQARVRLAVAV